MEHRLGQELLAARLAGQGAGAWRCRHWRRTARRSRPDRPRSTSRRRRCRQWSASITRSSRPPFSAAAAMSAALPGDLDRHRVEDGCRRSRRCPPPRRPAASAAGQRVDAAGDRLQALGAVPDRVGGRHVGEQRLRGADVGGRLVAADVLLARLQGEAIAGPALACRSTGRPGGRASAASACRRPRNRRHAGRQSPSARRSAASEPTAMSAPSSAGASVSVRPADRRRRRPARPLRLAFAIAAPWSP